MAREVSMDYFAAHALELIEEAAEKQEEFVILKNGKPLATFVPTLERGRKTLDETRAEGVKIDDIAEPLSDEGDTREWTLEKLRSLGGRILGDIVEPID